jgi:carboxypeptidase T
MAVASMVIGRYLIRGLMMPQLGAGAGRRPLPYGVFANAALVLSLLVVPLHARQSGEGGRLMVRIEAANVAAVADNLQAAGYDVVRVDVVHSTIDLAVTKAEWLTLRSKGYNTTVLDRTRPLRDTLVSSSQSTTATAGAAVQTTDSSVATLAAPVTTAVATSDATTYLELDGIVARMQAIAAQFPSIAQFVDITTTYQTPPTVESRHLFALKISDNVEVDEDEPAMLIVAAHHAREINTPVIALAAAERLTSGYGSDPRITSAVDSHEIWIAPVWNPDGYTYVFTTDNMWRKNRRVFSTGAGVDQNRNYSQGWATSCAGRTTVSSETYKGPSAASEAETQTMMTWSRRERFAKIIDYHSYGREVLYAYRCLNHPFTSWMQQEAAAISEASGYGGLTRVPSANGEHPEWQFAQMGAYAFLIETHTEFQPPYQSAVTEASLVWPGILSVLERPIPVTGHVTDAADGAPLAAKIELLNVAFSQGETNASGGAYGAYHIFMPPGTYNVRFSAPGYSPVVSSVTVTSTSSVVNDVQLSVAPPAPAEETVFFDNFESATGWTMNAAGTDTATTGRWELGDPQSTSSSGPKQLGTTASGMNDLVTGRLPGTSAGVYDIDAARRRVRTTCASPWSAALARLCSRSLAAGPMTSTVSRNSTSSVFHVGFVAPFSRSDNPPSFVNLPIPN